MRRLILCVDDKCIQEGPEGYWTYCVSMVEAYAKLYDYDFIYAETKESVFGRHASWNRIIAPLKHIKEYDEILCINSAVAIIRQDVDVFDYLKNAPVSQWERDATVKPLIYTVVDKPTNVKHACSGIFLLDCSDKEAATQIMEDWWNDISDKMYETQHPYEQSVWNNAWINDRAKASKIRVADIWTAQEYDKDQVFMHIIDAYKLSRIFEAKKYFYRTINKTTCKKRIGIFVRQQNYYTNGAGQNCIFMKQSLEATGHNVDLLIVNPDKTKMFVSDTISYIYTDFATVRTEDYCLFVIGSYLPPAKEMQRVKQSGVEVSMFNPCNPFDQFHNDNFLYSCKPSSTPLQEMMFHKFADQVWITENHKETGKTYLEVINRNKVPINPVPLIWNPLFLYNKGVVSVYTDRTGPKIDIVIIEPNINYCKSGWLPLVAAEKLYLEQPDLINKVYFFNSPDSNPTAMGMIRSLKLFEDKKISLLARMQINEILAHFAKPSENHVIFVSHQTHLPMNYAYYDILYSGFPFVHNSSVLQERDLGYAYNEVDLTGAVHAILRAAKEHNVNTALAKARRFTDDNDPYNPTVIQTFQDLLVCDKPKRVEVETNPLVLTYDNMPTEGTKFYLETLERNKWTYKLVGGGDTWNGWKTRAAGYRTALDRIHDDRVVVLTDARDVVCLRSPVSFQEAFDSYGADMIVSMELTSGGVIGGSDKPVYNCIPLTEYWNFHGCVNPPTRQFVNAGLLCGKSKALKQFLDWFLASAHSDDQMALGSYMNENPGRICADVGAKLLHTTNFGINGGAQDVQTQASDSPSMAELCGRSAFFLHVPHGISKGQEHLYKQTCSILKLGISESAINSVYNYESVSWDQKLKPS